MTLEKYNPKQIVIYSRDEMKQWDMAQKFENRIMITCIGITSNKQLI
jgi:FlaA1/EpsC-like NDP-sugar epimerase